MWKVRCPLHAASRGQSRNPLGRRCDLTANLPATTTKSIGYGAGKGNRGCGNRTGATLVGTLDALGFSLIAMSPAALNLLADLSRLPLGSTFSARARYGKKP